jgi:hypothetical protein
MNNEVEVIAQTCHAANRAFANATGSPGIPDWAGTSESQKNHTRDRVAGQLRMLRTGGGNAGTIAASADTRDPPDDASTAIQDSIFNGIVLGFYNAGQALQQQTAAA